jgi:hypothetical protein
VTKNGKIDGACDGKNEWDNALRRLVPRCLNMAIVKANDQSPVDMSELHGQLDDLFEYLNHELSARNFRNCIRQFMKFKPARLKTCYKRNGCTTCPMGVDANQRTSLVAYWFEQDTKKKIDQLTDARGVIINVSRYGHGGKTRAEAKLVCHFQPFKKIFDFLCILSLTFYSEWVIRFRDFIGLQRMENCRSPSLSEMAIVGLNFVNN